MRATRPIAFLRLFFDGFVVTMSASTGQSQTTNLIRLLDEDGMKSVLAYEV